MKQVPSRSTDRSKSTFSEALIASTLEFVSPRHLNGYLAAASRLYDRGRRNFVLYASDADLSLAREIQSHLATHFRDATCVLETEQGIPNIKRLPVPASNRDAVFLLESRADRLSAALMNFINVPVSIVAPITEHFFRRRAVYVITVPKSGTHMLFELLSAFNLINGEQGHSPLSMRHFYYVASTNSHTSAPEFFGSLADWPRGGAEHPFFVTPTLFMYRNPLDVVVSEAHYFQDPAKTSLAHYFSDLSMDERLLRLIGDDPLLGSLRRRLGHYLPWLHLPNVIPLSFEELVGPQGGGSLEEQLKTIWSLQLKLHIPGSPAYYAAAVARRESETFRKGAINSHLDHLSEACYCAFRELNQDFMRELGYDLDDDFAPGYVPRFVDRFRHRPLTLKRPAITSGKKTSSHGPREFATDAVYAYQGYLAASLGRVCCALPLTSPRPIDPRLATGGTHFHVASTWDELFRKLDANSLATGTGDPRIVRELRADDLFRLDPGPPILVAADVCGFNIVEFAGLFYCVDLDRGPLDIEWDDTSGIFAASTIEDAQSYCQRLSLTATTNDPNLAAAVGQSSHLTP